MTLHGLDLAPLVVAQAWQLTALILAVLLATRWWTHRCTQSQATPLPWRMELRNPPPSRPRRLTSYFGAAPYVG
jgi:hypothetical protein